MLGSWDDHQHGRLFLLFCHSQRCSRTRGALAHRLHLLCPLGHFVVLGNLLVQSLKSGIERRRVSVGVERRRLAEQHCRSSRFGWARLRAKQRTSDGTKLTVFEVLCHSDLALLAHPVAHFAADVRENFHEHPDSLFAVDSTPPVYRIAVIRVMTCRWSTCCNRGMDSGLAERRGFCGAVHWLVA